MIVFYYIKKLLFLILIYKFGKKKTKLILLDIYTTYCCLQFFNV